MDKKQQQPKGILNREGECISHANKKNVRFKFPRKRKGKTFPSQIKVLYANANGIGDKEASLETAAHIYDAHIIAISETKQLTPKAKGYGKWNSKERKNRAGGGVAVAVRQDLVGQTSRVEGLDEEDHEIVWIEIRKNSKEKQYIGTYYGKQENAKS